MGVAHKEEGGKVVKMEVCAAEGTGPARREGIDGGISDTDPRAANVSR